MTPGQLYAAMMAIAAVGFLLLFFRLLDTGRLRWFLALMVWMIAAMLVPGIVLYRP